MEINIIPPNDFENAFKVTVLDAVVGSTITIENTLSKRIMAVHTVTNSPDEFWISGVAPKATLRATVT